ncbi:MAG: hypothetical protein Q9191_007867 [Dirinaria sp. TL-2023a]
MSLNPNKRRHDGDQFQERKKHKKPKSSNNVHQKIGCVQQTGQYDQRKPPTPTKSDASSQNNNPTNGSQHFKTKPSTHHRNKGTSAKLPPLPPILDPSLCDAPFTHQALVGPSNPTSYERLEFLGDAYIELVASRAIYRHFPNMTAGRMSQKRELLVKNETLAEYALAYGFDQKARLPSDFGSRGKNREKLWTKTLGDMFEAYVAAVVLGDSASGFATLEAWLAELWAPKLFQEVDDLAAPENMNAKVHLSQRVGGKGVVVEYRPEKPPELIRKEGKEKYDVGVYCTGWGWKEQFLGRGLGLSIKEAGIQAAMQALENPITEEIASKKKEFDAAVRAEREKVEKQGIDAGGEKEH